MGDQSLLHQSGDVRRPRGQHGAMQCHELVHTATHETTRQRRHRLGRPRLIERLVGVPRRQRRRPIPIRLPLQHLQHLQHLHLYFVLHLLCFLYRLPCPSFHSRQERLCLRKRGTRSKGHRAQPRVDLRVLEIGVARKEAQQLEQPARIVYCEQEPLGALSMEARTCVRSGVLARSMPMPVALTVTIEEELHPHQVGLELLRVVEDEEQRLLERHQLATQLKRDGHARLAKHEHRECRGWCAQGRHQPLLDIPKVAAGIVVDDIDGHIKHARLHACARGRVASAYRGIKCCRTHPPRRKARAR